MTVAIVTATAFGDQHRRRAWEWVQARYHALTPEWEIVTGNVDGTWSKGAAIRDAVDRTDADVLVITDADVAIGQDLRPLVELVTTGRHRWASPHHHVLRFTIEATERILEGTDPAELEQERNARSESHRAMPGGGIVIVDRALYDECPIDPRFTGWGGEDEAWAFALTTIGGRRHRGSGTLWHLWHPPAERLNRRIGSDANEKLRARYQSAGGNVEAMRALIAEGRRCQSKTSSSPRSPSSTPA